MGGILVDLIEYTDNDKKIIKSFKSKSGLSSEIFDKTSKGYKLNPEIKKQLLKISDDFIESVGFDLFVYDIILTGSLANYNWSIYSDVDLHVVVDTSEVTDGHPGMEEILKELFDAKKNLWNDKHDVKIKNFDVEVYIQNIDEDHVSTGVYSIVNDEWVQEPDRENPSVDEKNILLKGDEISRKIDTIIKDKSTDYKSMIEKVESLLKKIKTFRQSGLESGGEFSIENLTFKLLRRNGYIDKLWDFKKILGDKLLSL